MSLPSEYTASEDEFVYGLNPTQRMVYWQLKKDQKAATLESVRKLLDCESKTCHIVPAETAATHLLQRMSL